MSYFKVIATVEKVSDPKSLDPDSSSHVVLPCRMYKEGDQIVIEDNQINMSETSGALCLSLVASMIPVLKAMQRGVKPIKEKDKVKNDSTQAVSWFTCPDAERPVIFKIHRELRELPGWVVAEELSLINPDKRVHLHTPNPTDEKRGDSENIWNKVMK